MNPNVMINRSGNLALSTTNCMPSKISSAFQRIAPKKSRRQGWTNFFHASSHSTRNLTKRPPIIHADHSLQKSRRMSAAQLFARSLCVSRNCYGCWDGFGFLNFCTASRNCGIRDAMKYSVEESWSLNSR
ncbi:hypothetical protein CEXT_740361 [Caerostris extrusa]|uniref:Uncharacterized protein n=1 Tax=Caerostris extrusa TaxID=172846 RepID=A0AAV4SNV4_CAEEX|nr:hypothetical protein CEXT_740361 [Caerostris extrusa]